MQLFIKGKNVLKLSSIGKEIEEKAKEYIKIREKSTTFKTMKKEIIMELMERISKLNYLNKDKITKKTLKHISKIHIKCNQSFEKKSYMIEKEGPPSKKLIKKLLNQYCEIKNINFLDWIKIYYLHSHNEIPSTEDILKVWNEINMYSVIIKNLVINRTFTQLPDAKTFIIVPFSILNALLKDLNLLNEKNELQFIIPDIVKDKNEEAESILAGTIKAFSITYALMNFIHPFTDYNGRSSRTLLSFYMTKLGLLPPLFVEETKVEDDRKKYLMKIGALHEYFDEEVRPILVKKGLNHYTKKWENWDEITKIILDKFLYNGRKIRDWNTYFANRILKHMEVRKINKDS